MHRLLVAAVLIALMGSACRGYQRQDSRATGYANALECVEVQGDPVERAARVCGRRGFHPAVPEYRGGFESALECVRGKGAGAAEAAAACRAGA